MASLSEEDERFVRLTLLLKKVSPRAVRNFFDKEFPPTYLPSTLNTNYNTLDNLKLKRVLNQAQWNLLFPTNGVPDSNNFDITLMICIIRNLTSINPPINGFDKLPVSGETTPGSDLARIKWYRNILAHRDSTTMSTSDFNMAWRNIEEAVSRLAGLSMKQECQELKVIILDQSNKKNMLEIKQAQKDLKELRKTITILSDPVPWNIRDLINEELEIWREDDKTFIETNGAKSVLKRIKENGCVVVTSSSGNGKTSLVRHVAIQMQNEGYEILPVSNPTEIIAWYNPSKKILFVVDDFCGTYSLNPMKFENWTNLMEKIKALVERKPVKLIMSCRLQVYRDKQMKLLSFFQSCECNLLSADLCLSKPEKQSIAEFYLKTNASKIKTLYDKFDCFPLLCQLYSKNPERNIVDFFANPFTVYKEEIDQLQTGSPYKYCALALCVVFNNNLKENCLTEDIDKDIQKCIENTYEACKVLKGTSRSALRDELDSLTRTFIRKVGEVYRTIHDKLFDFLAFYFGCEMIYCLINNATSQFISERFLFERKCKRDDFTIIVSDKYQQIYIKRMVDDWSKGYVQYVFCNINMVDQNFRHRYLLHLKGMDISKQKQLASKYDRNDHSTPLIICCFIGDVDLVKWCLHYCLSNVNHCRKGDGVSPLFAAIQEGHTEIVQMLINNNADIIRCTDIGESPLFFACSNRHTEVVQLLINNKADINKCRHNGESPLYVACYVGHDEVVKMLINNMADINKCDNRNISPLFMACHYGYTKVVQTLINNKADVEKCNNEKISPLYIACQIGFAEVVQVLINNKADINKCRDTGHSPLSIVCSNGHTELVKMLINNKADINKCSDNGESPLYIACKEGHTGVVKMLINNKADVNKCIHTGESPLFIACQYGHTEVVQILINNNADINKCKDTGISPLFVVCLTGYTKLVKLLINNKADVNKCIHTGESPLFFACQYGHTEVVQILINNKADINKCSDNGESPLYSACHEGHIEVVNLIMNNKAEINKCTDSGASPLFVACSYGYTRVVQKLINNKADIERCNDKEVSPLFIACQEGHIAIAKMLINNMADINKCRDTGESPLYISCCQGHTEVVKMLIKHKADINKCNNIAISPLCIAGKKGHTKIVQFLIHHKANINKFK